jgi:hypothetical protein
VQLHCRIGSIIAYMRYQIDTGDVASPISSRLALDALFEQAGPNNQGCNINLCSKFSGLSELDRYIHLLMARIRSTWLN